MSVVEYRRSYWKTAAAAMLLVAASLAVLLALVLIATRGSADWGAASWIGWALLCAVAGVAGAGWGLVLAGGMVSLRRDRMESLGLPYARREPREWKPGPAWRALLRAARRLQALSLPCPTGRLGLVVGEEVEVRGLDEILATLDEGGALESLPFMPEMAAWCGRRLRVYRRADKIYDWVRTRGLRSQRDTVLLEDARCGGERHDGCQASCHLQWKEAWLRRTGGPFPSNALASPPARLTRHGLERLARRAEEDGAMRYVCQATELGRGGSPLSPSDPRHYLRDLLAGNLRPAPLLTGISLALFNWVQTLRMGVTFPVRTPAGGQATPHGTLDLAPGETVRVRSKQEIERTLDARFRNRGLWFDREMLRFCGGEYRVASRVERVIDESSGRMVRITNPCVILDGVTASGEYLGMCAQNEAIFWREIWLARPGTGS